MGIGKIAHLARLGLSLLLVLSLGITGAGLAVAQTAETFEVWAIDQANADAGGNKLYIFRGSQLSGSAPVGAPEVVDLQAGATGVGDGPGVRPHLLLFNRAHTHGVLAAVASGHVLFIRASDRRVTGSVDVGEQAHGAVPSTDDQIVLVANQNGKKLARIRTDYARESYVHEIAADLDLGALEDAEHPDNAPICPVMFVDGTRKAYVTVRGGGMYVVDTAATPMRVLKEFGRSQVAPAGCGGIVLGNKAYVNSGTPNSSDLYVFDVRTDTLLRHISLTPFGSDAHGMVLTGAGRYLWVGNRGNGDNIVVIDTARDEVVGLIPDVGAAPDIMDIAPGIPGQLRCEPATTVMCLAPGGTRVFVSMRPPTPLTGGPSAAGERTGITVMQIAEGGRTGSRLFFVPVADGGADIHALTVRLTSVRGVGLPATGSAEQDGADEAAAGVEAGGE
jgi:DNA-binding beta-propeller fold protein YncE